MSEQTSTTKNDQSLQARCFSALRLAKDKLVDKGDAEGDLAWSVERLEKVLFSAETGKSSLLLECFLDLIYVLKKMEKQILREDALLRPIGLQVATANSISPIRLEWNYHNPNSLFVIEYASFDETNKPDWRVYSKTRSMSFTIRGLQQGKVYWFRISALSPAF